MSLTLSLLPQFYYLIAIFAIYAAQVVVENPWVRVLESLPDALERKKYGT